MIDVFTLLCKFFGHSFNQPEKNVFRQTTASQLPENYAIKTQNFDVMIKK